MTVGRWHLYGEVIEGAGYSVQIMHGDAPAPYEPEPSVETLDLIGGAGSKLTLPLLGSWMHEPTLAEINAVLPPGIEPREQADDEDEYGNRQVLDDEDDDW